MGARKVEEWPGLLRLWVADFLAPLPGFFLRKVATTLATRPGRGCPWGNGLGCLCAVLGEHQAPPARPGLSAAEPRITPHRTPHLGILQRQRDAPFAGRGRTIPSPDHVLLAPSAHRACSLCAQQRRRAGESRPSTARDYAAPPGRKRSADASEEPCPRLRPCGALVGAARCCSAPMALARRGGATAQRIGPAEHRAPCSLGPMHWHRGHGACAQPRRHGPSRVQRRAVARPVALQPCVDL